MLEEGLSVALRIILKLAGNSGSQVASYSFLEKIEELQNGQALVDLLKFVNNDAKAEMMKSPKIQQLIKNSFPLIKRSQEDKKKQKQKKKS